MFTFLVAIHLVVSICLVTAVLLQSGRGGGLAGVFGESSATQAMFGGRGAATFLTRATSGLGATFFLTSMLLALMTTSQPRAHQSLMQKEAEKQSSGQTTPTTPPGGGAPAVPPAQAPAPATAPATAPGGTPR